MLDGCLNLQDEGCSVSAVLSPGILRVFDGMRLLAEWPQLLIQVSDAIL